MKQNKLLLIVKRTNALLFGTLISIGDVSVTTAMASPRLDSWR